MTSGKRLHRDNIVRRAPDQVAAEVDEDVVMVNVETGYYYAVSDVAREIWEAIEQPRRISDLVDELLASHDVDRSTCEDETLRFLESLLDERLLQVSDGSPS